MKPVAQYTDPVFVWNRARLFSEVVVNFFSWAIGVVRVCPENKYGRSGLRIITVQKLNVKFYQQYVPRILKLFVPVWRMKDHEMCSIRKVKGTYILTSIELNVRAKSVSCQLGIV